MFGVVLGYAIFEGFAWYELNTQNIALSAANMNNSVTADNALKVTAQEIGKLEAANAIAIASGRPWVGVIQPSPTGISFDLIGSARQFRYTWEFKNGGNRPAILKRIRTTSHWYEHSCTEHPDYSLKAIPPVDGTTHLIDADAQGETNTILLPQTDSSTLLAMPIPEDIWERSLLPSDDPSKLFYCIYLQIEYRDAAYPETMHHTQSCKFIARFSDKFFFENCSNKYGLAD